MSSVSNINKISFWTTCARGAPVIEDGCVYTFTAVPLGATTIKTSGTIAFVVATNVGVADAVAVCVGVFSCVATGDGIAVGVFVGKLVAEGAEEGVGVGVLISGIADSKFMEISFGENSSAKLTSKNQYFPHRF